MRIAGFCHTDVHTNRTSPNKAEHQYKYEREQQRKHHRRRAADYGSETGLGYGKRCFKIAVWFFVHCSSISPTQTLPGREGLKRHFIFCLIFKVSSTGGDLE